MNRLKKQIDYAKFTENSIVTLDIDYAERLLLELTKQYKSPTLEEVKKEWEELGYVWKEDDYFISLKYYFDKYAGIKIIIEKHTKRFWKEEGHFEILAVDFVEYQLLTKTFKALGWL